MKTPLSFILILLLSAAALPHAQALSCTINNPSLVFGSFNALIDSHVDSTTRMTVSCDASSTYSLTLSQGNSGVYSSRFMKSGSDQLYYNIYLDPAYSQIWGDGTGGSHNLTDAINATASKDYSVYGRIPISIQRNAKVGSYSDSIIMTLTY